MSKEFKFKLKESKQKCIECDKSLSVCVCNIFEYLKIGSVSAVDFMDNYVEHGEHSDSPFYQGWAYKHAQVKYFYNQLQSLQKENQELKKRLNDLSDLIWEHFFS